MSVLVADFGGTRIKMGLIEDGRLQAVRIRETSAKGTLEQQLPDVRQVLEELAALAESSPEAMSWALPCLVAPDNETVTRTFGKFDDAGTLDLGGWTERYFGIPLVLDNDARAAAIGEWRYGAGRACDHMVMVTLGTGIGTAVISEGRPMYGRTGLAGNLGGHNIIRAEGAPCVCGLRGCAEAHVGSWAMREFARKSPLFAESALSNVETIDYRVVFELARAGDPLARELSESAIHDWTIVLVNLIHQFDPERIVIGGGIMAGKDEILPSLESSLRRMLPLSSDVTLHAAALGDSAALLGCEAICAAHLSLR